MLTNRFVLIDAFALIYCYREFARKVAESVKVDYCYISVIKCLRKIKNFRKGKKWLMVLK